MRLSIPALLALALMAGGCRRESFDDQWRRESNEAGQSASAMEREMHARLRVAQQAGHGLGVEAASSGP